MEKRRLIDKPWGYEEIWAETSNYVSKIIFIRRGHRLSLQLHSKKEETIRVVSGVLTLVYGGNDSLQERVMFENDFFHIAPGLVHRFCANYGDVMIMEVSTPGDDDVFRIEDDYGR